MSVFPLSKTEQKEIINNGKGSSRELSSKYDISVSGSMDIAQKYFSSLSSAQQAMCEKIIGKKEWAEMGCCSRFWSYLRCESYQEIGKKIIKAIPYTYIVIYKSLKLKNESNKAQEEANFPNLKIDNRILNRLQLEKKEELRVIQVQEKNNSDPKA
jgi:hypothetical protein